MLVSLDCMVKLLRYEMFTSDNLCLFLIEIIVEVYFVSSFESHMMICLPLQIMLTICWVDLKFKLRRENSRPTWTTLALYFGKTEAKAPVLVFTPGCVAISALVSASLSTILLV